MWYCILFLSGGCGQGKLNIVRHEGVHEILRKVTSLHVLICKLPALFTEQCIHGNVVLNFCLSLHTCAHTNK